MRTPAISASTVSFAEGLIMFRGPGRETNTWSVSSRVLTASAVTFLGFGFAGLILKWLAAASKRSLPICHDEILRVTNAP